MRPQLAPDLIEALAGSVSRRVGWIWVNLHTRANLETGAAWPALRTMEEALRIRRHHLIDEIRSLESAGWLTVQRSRSTHNRYILTTPEGGPQGGTSAVLKAVPEHIKNTEENTKRTPSAKGRTLESLIQRWNRIPLVCLCRKPTDSRKRAFDARLKDPGWGEDVSAALKRVAASRFCTGDNDRGWKADIDWFLRPDTLTKILEGKYDDRNGTRGEPRGEPYVFKASE